MLLIGFAGGLRRSEITGLDLGRNQTEDGRGWIEMLDKGLLVTLTLCGKTGWCEAEIGRGILRCHLPCRCHRNLDQIRKTRQRPAFPPREG